MKITNLSLNGAAEIHSSTLKDERGWFSRYFCQKELSLINGDKNIFTQNTVNDDQASATVVPGERSEFSYNKVTRTGALQSDGSVFQGTRNYVADSKVHHNYIYTGGTLFIRLL